MASSQLQGMRVAILATDDFEQSELTEPKKALEEAGAQALIVSASLAGLARDITDEIAAVRVRLAFGGDVDGYDSYDDALAWASSERPATQPRGSDML